MGLSPEESQQVHFDKITHFIRSTLTSNQTYGIYGIHGSANALKEWLQSTDLAQKFLVYYDIGHPHFDHIHRNPMSLIHHRSHYDYETNPIPDYLVIYTTQAHYLEITRFFNYKVKADSHLILPFLENNSWPLTSIENKKPIVISLFPCAGASRLSPVITALLSYSKRTFKNEDPLNLNYRYNDLDLSQKNQSTTDRYYQHKIQSLDYFEYLIIHEPISSHILETAHNIQCTYLIRDPRDILTSYYFRSYNNTYQDTQETPELKEQHLLALIEGQRRVLPNYFVLWPSLKEMVSNFISAKALKQVKIVKFESLQQSPLLTYQNILKWLNIQHTPFVSIPDELIIEAIKLSSFHYQTAGTRSRGGNDQPLVQQGVTHSCRKGIIGDWKNHFSQTVIDKVKESIGSELIELGYETDLNW